MFDKIDFSKINEKIPCNIHKEYKKGCKDCFDKNRPKKDDDGGNWIHDRDMECRG